MIASIGSDHDLIIDLFDLNDDQSIFALVEEHISLYGSQPVIYNPFQNETFFLAFRERFPELRLFVFFSDDEWRHSRFDRIVALFADVFSVTSRTNVSKYRDYGLKNVIFLPWACNPVDFHPVETSADYQVTFVGSAYGPRVEYVKYLVSNGVDVRVFGKGWNKIRSLKASWGGHPSHEEALAVFSGSKINLSFLWTSQNPETMQVKGRTLELAACQAFQLTNAAPDLAAFGFRPEEHVGVFLDKEDLLAKTNYYLARSKERAAIKERAYKHVVGHHTWSNRFEGVLEFLRTASRPRLPVLRILLVGRTVQEYRVPKVGPQLYVDYCVQSDLLQQTSENYAAVFFVRNESNIDYRMLYALAFYRQADRSDVAVSAFYVRWRNDTVWIRLGNASLLCRTLPRRLLPVEVAGYAPSAIRTSGLPSFFATPEKITVSEYPFIVAEHVGILRRRLLRAIWGHYATKSKLKLALRRVDIVGAMGILIDAFVQRFIVGHHN